MFFLLADVELRRRTGNRTGLQQVLQSTVAEGGNITQQWTIDRFNAVGARATGTDVLGELYECMKDTPRNVDLIALWRDLGVKLVGRNVQYDDAAQLAHIRGAITARLASPVRESLSALRPGLVERSQVNAEPKQYSGNEAPCRSFPWISER